MPELDSFLLLRIRQRALRKGVWFRVLDRAERAMLYLVPRCMDTPRSSKLIDMLAKIVVKISDALKGQIHVLIGQVGRPLARRLSRIAQKWGRETAVDWALDVGFWKYLTIVRMNDIPAFRVGDM